MRRNLDHVKHLLDLVQAYANEDGIYLVELLDKWSSSSGNPDKPLDEPECIYLANLCAGAGFLSIAGSNLIQLTWAGHDYLDSITIKPNS
ncbi:DUF2513 domain-containing protein [Pseudomonas sp. 6D_7.1_Bac1]|uniref:DUF2513 domain-containing protein n=1 Tax=Pseudomonas sp. 6D_7.1_Bac1 TaxID=2971615 RepID=UPI0021C76F7F|nr:DUF2513 domain-containing protein [Pseudomonas sp. 6D_7.1_Bac1]MCU1752165.1 DUF2513 domain-containing protein [Pseudomonas sp. 6D_7.1_Bac1]